MNIQLPPPLAQAYPPRSFLQDFLLLATAQARLTRNKIRQWPLKIWLIIVLPGLSLLAMFVYLGSLAYGALASLTPDFARGFLSLLFMAGAAGQVFFGITAAFAALYMSEDLELLFLAPVSSRAVFAVKSLSVAFSNLLPVTLFILLPGIFYGLLFGVPSAFYIWVLLVALGMLTLGTALAELINLGVMRIVPPHRSKEAIGVIGAVSGILIALVFQIPNLVMSSKGAFNLGDWLSNQEGLLRVMDYFPWGWSSLALSNIASGQHLSALGWTALVLGSGAAVFYGSFLLVEKGFRRGWISLTQGEGSRKSKAGASPKREQKLAAKAAVLKSEPAAAGLASPWQGMWAVAKKDLVYMKRDSREWFGYLTPLLLMIFFVGRFLFLPGPGAQESMVMILIMYTVMFSGNIALQSFGREGESDWLLNSVPLAGWPVVWGKLAATVLPTLVLMEALLTGTGLAVGLPPTILVSLTLGAALISLGSSSIGLFFSINNSRYNPDKPQQRVSGGAVLVMYLINLVFIGVLAICLLYAFPPEQLVHLIRELPAVPFTWGFPETLLYLLYLIVVPLKWAPAVRISFGILVTMGLWAAVFFGFMRATVRQSLKGFRVELVTTTKKTKSGR